MSSRDPMRAKTNKIVVGGLDPAINLLRMNLLKIDGYAGQARI
jgi:hypothetical protein